MGGTGAGGTGVCTGGGQPFFATGSQEAGKSNIE